MNSPRRYNCGAGLSLLPLLLSVLAVPFALAQSNIHPLNKYAWGENIGRQNWRDTGLPGGGGALVSSSFLSGFIWSENTGWLFLGDGTPAGVGPAGPRYTNAVASDTGVNIESDGRLTGFAWGENIGWVNCDTVPVAGPLGARISLCCPLGRLRGYAWGENIGWLNLEPGFGNVQLAPGLARAKADLNGDTLRDGRDTQLFTATLLSPLTAAPAAFCAADMNSDDAVTMADLPLFVDCLLNNNCVCP